MSRFRVSQISHKIFVEVRYLNVWIWKCTNFKTTLSAREIPMSFCEEKDRLETSVNILKLITRKVNTKREKKEMVTTQ